jgi:hypothetical protein
METGLHRYRRDDGVVLAYVFKLGRKYISFVLMSHCPVKVVRVRKDEAKYFDPLQYTGTKNRLLEVGGRIGITNGAIKALS